MSTQYALIHNDRVYGISDAPWTYVDGKWKTVGRSLLHVDPSATQAVYEGVSGGTRLTPFALRNRFSMTEKEDLVQAARAATRGGARLQVFLDDLTSASWVDLTDPYIETALNALETAGIIGAGRASEILNEPVKDYEAP